MLKRVIGKIADVVDYISTLMGALWCIFLFITTIVLVLVTTVPMKGIPMLWYVPWFQTVWEGVTIGGLIILIMIRLLGTILQLVEVKLS